MASEYLKPMLDVGSPRVFNCNVVTRQILAKDPEAGVFFKCKPINKILLIKDAIPENESHGNTSAIGTKVYFPFNEKDIYEGGRTMFFHDRNIEKAFIDMYGAGALPAADFEDDMRKIRLLDRLPSLDPFLMKDAMSNNGFQINPSYFEVSKELWHQIETYILKSFEPLVLAAFPNTVSATDEKARMLVQKIWEGRDLETLRPLAAAFHLPPGQELEIFSAWKGINYYTFQYARTKPLMFDMANWLKELTIPPVAISANERRELNAMLDEARNQLRVQWQIADTIIREYQSSYDKLFRLKEGSADFMAFLKKSNKAYWDIGNALGKVGHASYCWDIITKRYPNRKLPWEPLMEMIFLMSKVFASTKRAATAVSW